VSPGLLWPAAHPPMLDEHDEADERDAHFTGRYGTDRLVGMICGLIAKTNKDIEVATRRSVQFMSI